MIRSIVGVSLRFRFLVVVIAATLISFGIAQLRDVPVDVLPEFSPPFVEIQTEALGLSAEEVEQMITVPMEQDLLAGVAWLDTIRSESVPGLSSVVVYFEPGTDLYRARQMVSERLSQAAVGLPHVSKPPMMIQPQSSASRFIIVGLSSQELSLIETSVLARWVIAPRMLAVPGVANVAIWGQRDRQLQVQVDPERLRAQGVSLQDVVNTTGNALWVSSLTYLEASSPGTGGFIDTPSQRLGVWHVLPISSPEELAQVPLEGNSPLTLGEVANVVQDHQPLIGDAITDQGPSLMLVIEKLPGTNILEVTRGVEEAVAALQPGMKGVHFDTTLYRPANYIETAVSNLTRILLIAAVLAIVLLLALLWDWRVALISLVAIPVSLLAAVVVLYLRGATFNTMMLLGLIIALGAIVDDAIVDVENIARRLRQHRREGSDESPAAIVVEASVEIRSTVIFATLIIVLAVLPIFFLDGTAGALFRPLATSYVLATLMSLAVALLVTPALSLILLPGMADAPERRGSPLLSWLQRGYDWMLARTIRRAQLAVWAAAIAIIVVAGVAGFMILRQGPLDGSLARDVPLPTLQEPYLTIEWEGAPGTSHPEMERIMARASDELRALAGVRNVGGHVGRAVYGDQVVGINSGELWVSIDPAADYDAAVAAVQETVDGYPGLNHKVSTYLQQTLGKPQASNSNDITVRVFGEDYSTLRSEAEKVRQSLEGIRGVVNPRVILPAEEPTLEIEVDLAVAQTQGIKPGDVRRAAAILLSGLQVGSLFEQQKVFDVVVWSTPAARQSLTDVRELLIDTPGGGQVRLGDVADVRIASAPTVIRRESISPYLDVSFDVQRRGLGAVANDVEAALQGVQFPLEYHAEVLGSYAAHQAAQQRVLIAGIIAAIGIFLLLQAALNSWRLAWLAWLILPFALAGGAIVAVLASDGALSFAQLLGLLPVLAIAVRSSIVLISCYQRLEHDEGEQFGPELVLRGSRERAAPMLLSVLTTAVVFLPFAIAGKVPGNEITSAIAAVALGGLATTTLLTLFLMPALYLRFGSSRAPVVASYPAAVPEASR